MWNNTHSLSLELLATPRERAQQRNAEITVPMATMWPLVHHTPAVHPHALNSTYVGSPEVNLLGLLQQCLELILGLHQLVPEKPLVLLLTLLLSNRQTHKQTNRRAYNTHKTCWLAAVRGKCTSTKKLEAITHHSSYTCFMVRLLEAHFVGGKLVGRKPHICKYFVKNQLSIANEYRKQFEWWAPVET